MAWNMKMELLTFFSLILYQSKCCGLRIHVLFMMYDVYRYCQMKKKRMIMKILKKEWFIWKFWKKGGGNEIHAPCTCGYIWKIHSELDVMQFCLSDSRFNFGKMRLLYIFIFGLLSFVLFWVFFWRKKCRFLMLKCMLTSSSSSISSAGDLYTNCCCSPSSSSSSNALPATKDNFLGSKTFCFFSFPLHPNFKCGVWSLATAFMIIWRWTTGAGYDFFPP